MLTLSETIGHGKGKAKRVELPGIPEFGEWLENGDSPDWWFCPALLRDGMRRTVAWEGAWLAGTDIDRKDADGTKLPSDAFHAMLDGAWESGVLPGTLWYPTPSGARVLWVFPEPVLDQQIYLRALAGCCNIIDPIIQTLKMTEAGWAVDRGTSTDVVRLYWGPRSRVGGTAREARVRYRETLYPAAQLARHGGGYRTRGSGGKRLPPEYVKAADAWNRDHPLDLPPRGRRTKCPACGSPKAFAALPGGDGEIWGCWSQNSHPKLSPPCGHAGNGYYWGRALDIEAHSRDCSPLDVLIDDRYVDRSEARDEVLRVGLHVTDNGEAIERDWDRYADEVLSLMPAESLYRRGSVAVKLKADDQGLPALEPLRPETMRVLVSRYQRHVSWRKVGRGEDAQQKLLWGPVTGEESKVLVQEAGTSTHVRQMRAVSWFPVVGEDLKVAEDGWNEETGIFYLPRADVKAAIVKSEEAKVRAWADLDDLVADFPFAGDGDRAAFYSLLLTLIMRPSLRTSPLFVVLSQKAGTGKTRILQEVASLIVMGIQSDVSQWAGREEERRKALMSDMLAGSPFIILDNVPGGSTIDSPALATLLTSGVINDRVLGLSKKAKIQSSAVLAATGNNIEMTDEIAQRCVSVTLEARWANPGMRDGFAHPDIRGYCRERRGAILAQLLGMINGWREAGCPKPRSKHRFDQWRDTVLGVLEWSYPESRGELDLTEHFQGFVDATLAEVDRHVVELVQAFVDRGMVWMSNIEIMKVCDELGLFSETLAASRESAQTQALAEALKKVKGAPVETKGGDVWKLENKKRGGKRGWGITRVIA